MSEPKNWLERVRARGITVFGDDTFRGECNKEDRDLINFFSDLKYEYPLLSKIALHVKNEGLRTKGEAAREKMKGALLRGAVDVHINGGPSFVMELKRRDYTQSDIDEDQVLYMERSKKTGAFTCVCLGYDAAIEALNVWIKLIGLTPEDMRID